MQTENSNKPLLGADNNALIALLSINLVVYALIGFLKVVYYLNSYPLEQFYTQIMEPEFYIHRPWNYCISPGPYLLIIGYMMVFGFYLPI